MKKYGLPYMGSKNKIAKKIIDALPSAEYFVDLFGGGCAMTHCAMESGKYKKFIVNDINDAPKLFKACIEGELKGYSTIPTREEFKESDDMVVKLVNSFGNGGTSNAYGRNIEKYKVHAQKMVSMPSMWERRQEYRKFIKALKEYLSENERLESLERLEVYKGDYMDVRIPQDSVVYCDIPYINTDCKMYSGFDWERYYKWLDRIEHPVFTSEYTAPRKGLIKFENYDYESQKRFGAWAKAYYDRKLTEEEVQSYELVYGGQEND